MYIDNYGRIMPGDPNELFHHGVKGMHWYIRRYQPYPSNYRGDGKFVGKKYKAKTSASLADDIFGKASKKEPKISIDVKNAARVSGSKMYGLEHRLKTKESIQRKIETDSLEKEISSDKAANDLKDAVRYTTITNDNQFVSSYNKFKRSMEARGYEEVRCKNYFDLYKQGKVKHKSVQSVFQDRDGYLFEVQFQTPASQRAKDLKVPIYEERRKPGLSESRQKELEKQMVDLAENVPYPKGIYSIKSHDTPSKVSTTKTVTSRVKALRSSGMTYAEIAKKLGISESSVGHYLNL